MVYLGTRHEGKRGQMVYSKGNGDVQKHDFTLIICFSRMWCFQKFFESFEKMKIPMGKCHLLIFDNSNNKSLRDALLDRAKAYSGSFKSVRLYKSWRLYQRPLLTAKTITWKDSQNGPILGMHLDSLRLCKTEKFVMIEDDTTCPVGAVPRLLDALEKNPKCGMVTGIQAMRQSAAYMVSYPAVYYVTKKGGRIVESVTLSPYLRGLHQIDGTGWYCFASYKKIFMQATRKIMKLDDRTRNFAVDVMHVSYIRDAGYDVLADFGVWTGHFMLDGKSMFTWGKELCKPMLSTWSEIWQTHARVSNLKEPIHYKLLRRLTRKRDRN